MSKIDTLKNYDWPGDYQSFMDRFGPLVGRDFSKLSKKELTGLVGALFEEVGFMNNKMQIIGEAIGELDDKKKDKFEKID